MKKVARPSMFDAVNYEKERLKQQNIVGFQKLEKTAEYQEKHYFEGSKNSKIYGMNSFFKDYILYLQSNTMGATSGNDSFLSSNFIDVDSTVLPFVFAMLDVPIHSPKSANKIKSDGKRGINIEAGSNFILFKREIKDG